MISVNLAATGKFHVLNYLELLDSALDVRFYTSARVNQAPGRNVISSPLKQYLMQGQALALGPMLREATTPLYDAIWQRQSLSKWRPADITHLLSHGAALDIIDRSRRNGAVIVCEAVNTHPLNRLEIMLAEADRWGLKARPGRLRGREERQVREAEMADLLLAPSRAVADSYRKFGIHCTQAVIPYAANIARFVSSGHRPTTGDHGPLKVVCVGQIGLRKGQFYLIEAVRKLGVKAVSLTLVGGVDPSARPFLDRHRQYFSHVERVSHADMPALLARHDVFVSASLEEGLAVSIAEALAMGLAVVATRESGAEEIIDPGVTGILTPSRSSDALADALQSLLADPAGRDSMSAAARASTVQSVNWQTYADRIGRLYRGLVGG